MTNAKTIAVAFFANVALIAIATPANAQDAIGGAHDAALQQNLNSAMHATHARFEARLMTVSANRMQTQIAGMDNTPITLADAAPEIAPAQVEKPTFRLAGAFN